MLPFRNKVRQWVLAAMVRVPADLAWKQSRSRTRQVQSRLVTLSLQFAHIHRASTTMTRSPKRQANNVGAHLISRVCRLEFVFMEGKHLRVDLLIITANDAFPSCE